VDGDPSDLTTEPVDRDNDGDGPRGAEFDLMSPPLGYPAHRRGRHFTYAMGLYGLAADGSAVVEMRELWPSRPYKMADFHAQALEFAAQRFETSAARKARIDLLITGAIAVVCGGNQPLAGDADAVLARLAQLPATEQSLARHRLIPAAFAAWVPPAPVPVAPVPVAPAQQAAGGAGQKRSAAADLQRGQEKRRKEDD
jgi:hypothetical protein